MPPSKLLPIRGRLRCILVSQNVMNLANTAMVGTLGDAALAAVGLDGLTNFMFTPLLQELSVEVCP